MEYAPVALLKCLLVGSADRINLLNPFHGPRSSTSTVQCQPSMLEEEDAFIATLWLWQNMSRRQRPMGDQLVLYSREALTIDPWARKGKAGPAGPAGPRSWTTSTTEWLLIIPGGIHYLYLLPDCCSLSGNKPWNHVTHASDSMSRLPGLACHSGIPVC